MRILARLETIEDFLLLNLEFIFGQDAGLAQLPHGLELDQATPYLTRTTEVYWLLGITVPKKLINDGSNLCVATSWAIRSRSRSFPQYVSSLQSIFSLAGDAG